MIVKFTGPADKIKLNFRKLPTPMVEWEGTAKQLHDIIMKWWVATEPEPISENCADCDRPKNDINFHFDAPGANQAAGLHWYKQST